MSEQQKKDKRLDPDALAALARPSTTPPPPPDFGGGAADDGVVDLKALASSMGTEEAPTDLESSPGVVVSGSASATELASPVTARASIPAPSEAKSALSAQPATRVAESSAQHTPEALPVSTVSTTTPAPASPKSGKGGFIAGLLVAGAAAAGFYFWQGQSAEQLAPTEMAAAPTHARAVEPATAEPVRAEGQVAPAVPEVMDEVGPGEPLAEGEGAAEGEEPVEAAANSAAGGDEDSEAQASAAEAAATQPTEADPAPRTARQRRARQRRAAAAAKKAESAKAEDEEATAAAAAPAKTEAKTETTAAAAAAEETPAAGEDRSMDALLDQALGGQKSAPARAAAAPAPAENANLPDKPSRSDVARTLGSLMPRIRQCAGDQVGLATATILVQGDGTVGSVAIGGSPFGGTPQGACMEKAVKSAKFSPFKQNVFRITYPFSIRAVQ